MLMRMNVLNDLELSDGLAYWNELNAISNENDLKYSDDDNVCDLDLLEDSDKKYIYELSYYKAKYLYPIIDEIKEQFYQYKSKSMKYRPNKKKINIVVSCFICNAIRCLSYDIDEFKISLDKNHYGKIVIDNNKNISISYDIHNELLKFLQEYEYITLDRGFWVQYEACESTITLLDKIKVMLEPYKNKSHHITIRDSVILREVKKDRYGNKIKRNLKFKENAITKESRKLLKKWNTLLLKTEIMINGSIKNNIQYKRIFNNDFEHGGRYYSLYGKIQNLSKEKRRLITHDGMKTIELDYKSIHPSILYDRLEIKYVDDFDPYEVSIENFGIKHATPEIKFELRQLGKDSFMSVLNSKSTPEAIGSISKKLREDAEQPDHSKRKYSHLPVYINAESFFTEICRVNERISDYFGTGIDVELQFMDSQMASYIIQHFTERNILVQCIHDSFIIQEDKVDELREVMELAYLHVVGSDFNCRIE